MGFRLSLPHIIQQQTNFSLSEMSRSYVCTITRRMISRSWPATLAISSHANTQIHTYTADCQGPARTFSLSLSLCWEWHFEKWWKMDLCPACNVEERHILSPKSHHRHTHFHMLHNTSFVEIESLHFILYHQVTVPTFLRTYHLASHWVRLEWLIGAKSPKSRNCSTFLCYPIEWSLVRLRAFITYAKKFTLRNLKKKKKIIYLSIPLRIYVCLRLGDLLKLITHSKRWSFFAWTYFFFFFYLKKSFWWLHAIQV